MLCCHQITTCLKFLAAQQNREVLKYFEDRIQHCLNELRKCIDSAATVNTTAASLPDSVLHTMDVVVDLLDAADEQVPVEDVTMAIDRLLSQVLLFKTVILPEDQNRVLDMCRCVLTKSLQLRNLNQEKGDAAVGEQVSPLLMIDGLRMSVLDL